MSSNELIQRFLTQQIELGGSSVVLPRTAEAEADVEVAAEVEVEVDVEPPQRKDEPSESWTAPGGRVVSGSAERVELAKLFYDVKGCTRCALGATRTRFVFGTGVADASVVLVGEAPGAAEDRKGLPFVGPAGKLLDELLAAVGLDRASNVFICNVLKCRPPGNRDPLPEEVELCTPILRRQLDILKPSLIVALGRFAAQALLGSDAPMGAMRRKVHSYGEIPLIATYHPAYLLRNRQAIADVEADLIEAAKLIEGESP